MIRDVSASRKIVSASFQVRLPEVARIAMAPLLALTLHAQAAAALRERENVAINAVG
jgi:hypothetical protein